jgi:hypothetical protein
MQIRILYGSYYGLANSTSCESEAGLETEQRPEGKPPGTGSGLGEDGWRLQFPSLFPFPSPIFALPFSSPLRICLFVNYLQMRVRATKIPIFAMMKFFL